MIRKQFIFIVYLIIQSLILANEKDIEDQILKYHRKESSLARHVNKAKNIINHNILSKYMKKDHPSYIYYLPTELKVKIINYLDPVSMLALKKSYQQFNALVTNKILLTKIPSDVRECFVCNTPPMQILLGDILYNRWLQKGRAKDLCSAASLGHIEANERVHEYRKQKVTMQTRQAYYQSHAAITCAFWGGYATVGY